MRPRGRLVSGSRPAPSKPVQRMGNQALKFFPIRLRFRLKISPDVCDLGQTIGRIGASLRESLAEL